MAWFNSRKPRTARAAEIRSSSLVRRSLSSLHNRSLVGRLALCLLAIVALTVAVHGWTAPFPYRLGQRPAQGITAKVEFDRRNVAATELALLDAEKRVPYFFVRDPALINGLPDKLRVSLNDVFNAKTLDDLSPQTRLAFGITIPEGGGKIAADTNPDVKAIKAVLTQQQGEDSVGNRISDIVSDFTRFISTIRNSGLADPAELERVGIRPDNDIAMVTRTGPSAGSPDGDERDASLRVKPDEVVLRDLLKETGPFGSSWGQYPSLSAIRPQLERWLLSQEPSSISLRYDSAITQRARREMRESTPPITFHYGVGSVLVPPGKAIDDDALELLRIEHDTISRSVRLDQRLVRIAAVLMLLCVLGGVNGYYIVRNEPRLVRGAGRLSVYLVSIVVAVALGRLLSNDPWRAEAIPVVAVAMVFAIAYNQVVATLMGLTIALIITLSTVGDFGSFIVLSSAATTAVIPLTSVPSRSTIIKVGFWSGIAYFVVSCGMGIVESPSGWAVWSDPALLFAALRGAGWCLVAGYLVAGSLPFIERTFGVVTDISLLEMSDISHPLLQELVRRAPGTYNHSIAVATIGETAADRIGANGLLLRVGAYYHDIGKMLKPHYFVENMTEGAASRHEHLAPAMSTLIIIGHVKDGVDLARRHNLPQPIVDFIEQHHGTTLVEYFYREASRIAEQQPDHRGDVEESSFRYPGPKPQTRELGVMMIADAVESASRTLSEPTPKRLEGLVHGIVMKRLLDGQFDECGLTLAELRTIEESLTKSLIGIYHGRIKYPEQRIA